MMELKEELPIFKESKLLGITLFHSFVPNKLFEVKAAGHTNNTGDNGAGKSTVLSLLPAFYGAEPSKLVDREADKSSFIGYYLPDAKSLIVFEYQKEGVRKCSVLYRNSASVAYRFVSCSAKELFAQNLHDQLIQSGMDAKSWLRKVVSEKYSVSDQIQTCVDYRSVILNNRSHHTQRRKANSKLTSMASEYSLCSAEFQMNHIDVLTATMMRHKKMLSRFKSMIVDCFLNNTYIDNVPYHKDNIELVNSLEVFVTLENQRKKFDTTLANKFELDSLLTELLALNQSINKLAVEQNAAHTQSKDQHRIVSKELNILSEEFNKKLKYLTSRLSEIEETIQRKTTLINALYEQREWYEDHENIMEKKAKFEQLESFIQEKNASYEHYQRLLEGVEEEATLLELNIKELQNKAVDFKSTKQSEISAIQDAKIQFINAGNEKREDLQVRLNQECELLSKSYQERLNSVECELNSFSTALGEAANYTPEQKAELSALNGEVEAKLGQHSNTQQILIDLANRKNDLVERRNENLALLKSRQDAQQDVLDKIAEISQQLEPVQGTFAHFLENNIPEWRTTFGKVIAPKLLKEKQLYPVLEECDSQQVFGVSIDLSSLEVPEFALSYERLVEMRDELLLQEKVYRKTVETVEHLVQEDNKEIDGIDKQSTIETSSLSRLQERVKQLQLIEQNKTESFDDYVEQQKANINVQIKRIKETKKSLEEERARMLDEKSEGIKLQKLQLKADLESVIAEEDEKVAYLERLIGEKLATTKRRIDDLKEAFTQTMREKGVDENSVNEAKTVYEELATKCDRVESYRSIISEYDMWRQTHWEGLVAHEVEKAKLKHALELQNVELSTYQQESGQTILDLEQKVNELDVCIKQYEESLEALHGSSNKIEKELGDDISRFEIDVESLEDPVIHSVSSIESMVNNQLSSINRLKKQITRNVKDVSNTIVSLGDKNEIKSIWDQLRDERLKKLQTTYDYEISYDTQDFAIASLADLERLITDVIPNTRTVKLEAVKSVSTQISNFHETLRQINSKIDRVSNTLGDSIETTNPFPAIDSIQVKLSSKIHTYEVWRELNTFSSELSKWTGSDKRGLPNKAFISSFRQLNESLKSVKISKDLDSLVEMEITVVEGGRSAIIKQDEDLEKVGSEGVSKLAIIVVFCGMTRFLCKDKNVTIHWPLDELGKISVSNLSKLFIMMNEKRISLFTAQPDPHHATLKYFVTKNHIEKGVGVKSFISTRSGKKNPLLNTSEVEAKLETETHE